MLNRKCCFCGSKENLVMSSRCVNGTVKTIDICMKCYWLEKFKAEGKVKEVREMDGILPEEELFGRIESAGSINPLGLRERV